MTRKTSQLQEEDHHHQQEDMEVRLLVNMVARLQDSMVSLNTPHKVATSQAHHHKEEAVLLQALATVRLAVVILLSRLTLEAHQDIELTSIALRLEMDRADSFSM